MTRAHWIVAAVALLVSAPAAYLAANELAETAIAYAYDVIDLP